jgi:putative ABC transport system permease protein
MPKKKSRIDRLSIDLSVGSFLAKRDLQRANIWTTFLISFVMLFTFLNLVVVSGILVGLIQGSFDQNRKFDTGDVIISPFQTREVIDQSPKVLGIVDALPGLKTYSYRYTHGGSVKADYRDVLLKDEKPNSMNTIVTGIDPEKEDKTTHLAGLVVEGQYLGADDGDSILLGSDLLATYNNNQFPGLSPLTGVGVGSKVLVTIGTSAKEFFVKGIIKSKVNNVRNRAFILESEFRKLAGRSDLNLNEIAIVLDTSTTADTAKAGLLAEGVGQYAKIQTYVEAVPSFLEQVKATFAILGNVISGIGLIVAAITIFIVIFVNAITRRRYIGILKGIGITPRAILISYMIQALFYAIIGSVLGAITVFGFLKPFIDVHPINFPFSDGILVANSSGTAIRAGVLIFATVIAGYIPARMVIKQNTLDAILGR